MQLVDYLKTLRYPGRFIVMGRIPEGALAIYGATGRSVASLARHYVWEEDGIYAEAADEESIKKGNRDLLEYRAYGKRLNGFVIANGKQGDLVRLPGFAQLAAEEPEPDDYKTPRITGGMWWDGEVPKAELHSVRSVVGKTERKSWTVPLSSGKGMYVATYAGEDVRPTPSFLGDPIEVELDFKSARAAVQDTYDALAPQKGGAEYRVGCISVLSRKPQDTEICILNRLSTD